ncbi:YhdP family protein [Marinobacterium lutimaris]|uniref:TIGR02099 family protein n=1 Tax=Marinobacterium lutimaris TaxID=568106 RepID=A0A1H6B0D6_9GAMM|nr:YhdP family protein [Marinobacterium lutimaris]SEG54040.1 TIGR02099 family protein [Marinobacterium lutimaris]
MIKASVKHLLWWSLMAAMLLGLLLIGLRLALPQLGSYREEIAEYLGSRLGVDLNIASLDARWDGYFPSATVHQLRVSSAGASGPEARLEISRIDVKLDPWRSLLGWQPVFKQLDLVAPHGFWRQHDGQWLHRPGAGDSSGAGNSSGMTEEGWSRLLNLLLSQPQVGIRGADLLLQPEQGEPRRLTGIDGLLENVNDEHQLSGSLRIAALGEDTRLEFAVQFQGTPTDPLLGDYPFYLKLDSLGPELLTLTDFDLPLSRLRAGTEFWGHWSLGRLAELQGRLAVGDLAYGEEGREFQLSNSTLDFALMPLADDAGGFQLQLNNIHLNSAETPFDLSQLAVEGHLQGKHFRPGRVLIPKLELAPLNAWLAQQALLPQQAVQALTELSPTGSLSNIELVWEPGAPLKAFAARADAQGVGMHGYYGAPAIEGASGLLEADIEGGRLSLRSDDFALHFPKLYQQGWHFSAAQGVISWQLRNDGALISSELLHLNDDKVSAEGRFSIDIPYSREEQTELTLMIGMRDSDGSQAQRFTPAHEVGQGLYDWLGRAIKQGHVRQAGLVLHGGTRRLEPRRLPTVQLFFDIDDARMDYDPNWPEVSDAELFLFIHNGDLRADVRSGKVMNTQVESGWAYKPLHDDRLQLAFQLAGPASDVNTLLALEPLQERVGRGMEDWHLEGDLTTALRLSVPVVHHEGEPVPEPGVWVQSSLSNGGLGSEALRLELSQLSGDISFSMDKGLNSDNLRARAFDRDVTGRIETLNGITTVQIDGSAQMPEVQEWSGVDVLRLVSGELDYKALLLLCNGQPKCVNRFELTSSLAGVAVDLPAPFGLKAETERNLRVRIPLASSELDFDYGGLIGGAFDLSGGPLRGSLKLGEGQPVLPSDNGIFVDGALQQLELGDINELLDRLESTGTMAARGSVGDKTAASEGAGSAENPLRRVVLDIGRFDIGGFAVKDVRAQLTPADVGWLLQLSGPEAQGQIILPDDDQPVEVALEHLLISPPDPYLNPEQGEEAGLSASVKQQEVLPLGDLPEVDLSVLDLVYKDMPLGRWNLKLRPRGSEIELQDIRGDLDQLKVRGEISWHHGERDHTGMTLKLEGQDIGRQLELWGLDKTLDSQMLESDLQLEWQGTPWDINAASLDGSAQLLLKDGHLIESGNSANLLRVFGILNFNTLGRRLRLDFSDLVEKGVAFDRLAADYRFDKGLASSVTPLLMEGPSANLRASGSIDFNNETVDKDIDVVLPLTSNVPFAAVLLGAPQVAGAVFLIDKLIGDKLEQVTTLGYHLSGDWGDPKVELDTAPPPQKESVFP